jgi:hypothetical protein
MEVCAFPVKHLYIRYNYKMNIIFLDFDGPLTNSRAYVAYDLPANRPLWTTADPVAIQMIKNLCNKYNARIVLSTSWRATSLTPTRVSAVNSLDVWGLNYPNDLIYRRDLPEFSLTPRIHDYDDSGKYLNTRSREIILWLETAKQNNYMPEKWCSIDDLPLNDQCNPVTVDPTDGMT